MEKILTVGLILIFGIYNFNLYISNNIDNYINERFFTFSFYASLITIIFSIVSILYILVKQRRFLKANASSFLKTRKDSFAITGLLFFLSLAGLFINSLLLILAAFLVIVFRKKLSFLKINSITIFAPIIALSFGILIPSQSLSSVTAFQREGDFNTVSLSPTGKNINGFTSTANYELGDWISTMNYNPDLSFYEGKEVDVTGFLFVRENSDENMFSVSRFVVTCCAVDARPVGLRVRYEWRDKFKVDDWLRVKGKFSVEEINGFDEVIIVADEVSKIEQPDRPYIY